MVNIWMLGTWIEIGILALALWNTFPLFAYHTLAIESLDMEKLNLIESLRFIRNFINDSILNFKKFQHCSRTFQSENALFQLREDFRGKCEETWFENSKF